MNHAFVTIAIPFANELQPQVSRILDPLGNPAADDPRHALNASAVIHFMSISAVPDTAERIAPLPLKITDDHRPGKDLTSGSAHLFIEITGDGGPHEALDAVYDAIGATLEAALVAAKVRSPPSAPPANDADRAAAKQATIAFLLKYSLNVGPRWFQTAGAVFDGAPGLSVRRIREEAALAHRIRTTMQNILSADLPPIEKLDQIRDNLWAMDQKWAFRPAPAAFLNPGHLSTVPARIRLALIALLKFIWPLFLIPPLMLWVAQVEQHVPLWQWPAHLAEVLWRDLRTLFMSPFNAAGGGLPGGFRRFGHLMVLLAGILGAEIAVFAAFCGLALIRLRHLEKTDPLNDAEPDPNAVEAVLRHENIGGQNLLAAMSVIKPGLFRRFLLKLAFQIAVENIRDMFRDGFLRDIGVIHFARWTRIPGTDKLMFWSNFSDGWESYIEDFITKAPDGLTAIWSNTQGFPPTSWLIKGGAADGDKFRRWARRQQYAPSFWYSAYPDLKMNQIRRNAAIRQGISGARTHAAAEDWINTFGSEVRPPFMLQKNELPTLVLGGLKRLRFSTVLVLRLPDSPTDARAWVTGQMPQITFGEAWNDDDDADANQAGAIAFTATGLAALGVSDDDLKTFPAPFYSGMSSPGRAQALGDVGVHAPDQWLWGRADRPAERTDAILVLYDINPDRLEQSVGYARDAIAAYPGGAVVFEQRLTERPSDPNEQVKEPFGFADGMSQPILRDSPRARIGGNADHVVEAGEFVLGYPDSRGYMPTTPTVWAKSDPARMLPEVAQRGTGVAVSFQGGGSDGKRDLGQNGTFLVVRQLEQDVDAFHAYTAAQAQFLSASGPFQHVDVGHVQKVIEAKMMGRWHDGSSLVRNPSGQPGRGVDNDFTFQREDPQGFACPFGAHVRRANPRDSIDTDSLEQLLLSNRHRILRIGRPYPKPEGGKPGLMFMCLNADIERQFEFLQQTWILGSSFHHLNEKDPLLGHHGGGGGFTIPTVQGPVRLDRAPDFVRVRGGGYFFMPGRKALRYLASAHLQTVTDLQDPAKPIAPAELAKA